MNSEYSIPTINSELITHVLDKVRTWNEELKENWIPSPAAMEVAQTMRNGCPRMAASLEKAEILEPFAEMLHDRVLDLKLAKREAGMNPSEAMSEARKELVPSNWGMQEEWLAASCDDYEPIPDPDLYGPDDPRHSQYVDSDEYDDEEEEIDDAQLRFGHGQLWTIQAKLREAVITALKNRKLSARQIMELGAFLWLVEHLPMNQEEYSGELELSVDYDEGSGWRSVAIGEGCMKLSQGETIRSNYGSDHSSKTVYEATTDGESDYSFDFDLDEWLWHFVRDCGDSDWDFLVSWDPGETMPGSVG